MKRLALLAMLAGCPADPAAPLHEGPCKRGVLQFGGAHFADEPYFGLDPGRDHEHEYDVPPIATGGVERVEVASGYTFDVSGTAFEVVDPAPILLATESGSAELCAYGDGDAPVDGVSIDVTDIVETHAVPSVHDAQPELLTTAPVNWRVFVGTHRHLGFAMLSNNNFRLADTGMRLIVLTEVGVSNAIQVAWDAVDVDLVESGTVVLEGDAAESGWGYATIDVVDHVDRITTPVSPVVVPTASVVCFEAFSEDALVLQAPWTFDTDAPGVIAVTTQQPNCASVTRLAPGAATLTAHVGKVSRAVRIVEP